VNTLPAPCLVVLVGPVASGKSTWARDTFTAEQIVSSDALRAVVGDSPHDLAASPDAFAVLDDIVARRMRRRLTTAVDTLGLDAAMRERWRQLAAAHHVPTVAVLFDTPAAECRRRNAVREARVPEATVSAQLRRWPAVREEVRAEGWDAVLEPDPVVVVPAALAASPRRRTASVAAAPGAAPEPAPTGPMRVGLMLSTFDWPGGRRTFAESLARVVGAADAAGVEHVWLMDHLRQIPQIGPAWQDLPDPFTTLAWIAARTTRVRLGVLVTPAFLRPPALLAKSIATLDVISAGRAMCGLGVGWFAAEYAAAGIAFPPLGARYHALEDALGALPAFWGKGAPPFTGRTVAAAEALSYPRPLQEHVPIWVGGGGERRTLPITARLADGANLQGPPDVVSRKVDVLRRHCREAGRDPAALTVSHLSTALIGRDRGEVADLVERMRPRRWSAERYAGAVHAGTLDDHAAHAGRLAAAGVDTMIVSLPDVAEPGALDRLAALVDRLR
jgi:alkanesulfonate monooxygenase SsuD/methylene tetrahydromethanopterin reductase-like flavin-dependent oxidoreductase (luciferase family)/predicted kinase